MELITQDIVPQKWKTNFNNGQMRGVQKYLIHLGLKRSDFLKSGTTCMVFNYLETQVLKVCSKAIAYFQYFKTKSKVSDFQDVVCHQFEGYFLPINEIIYEDSIYFIYLQDKVRILDLNEIDGPIYIKILNLVKKMLTEKIVTPDLISCNLGFLANGDQSDPLLLDYHDLTPLNIYDRKKKWIKIIRCLINFSSYLFYNKGFEEQFGQSLSLWKDETYIKQNQFANRYLPTNSLRKINQAERKNNQQQELDNSSPSDFKDDVKKVLVNSNNDHQQVQIRRKRSHHEHRKKETEKEKEKEKNKRKEKKRK
jgi:hypothetical protein